MTDLMPILDHEVNGVRMTRAQAETAYAFELSGYRVVGFTLGAIILRTRSARARVLVAPDGDVIPWYAH